MAAARRAGTVPSNVWCSGTDLAEHGPIKHYQRAVWRQDEGLCPVSSGAEAIIVQYFVRHSVPCSACYL